MQAADLLRLSLGVDLEQRQGRPLTPQGASRCIGSAPRLSHDDDLVAGGLHGAHQRGAADAQLLNQGTCPDPGGAARQLRLTLKAGDERPGIHGLSVTNTNTKKRRFSS
jgi:hypothetical protein